MDAGANGVGRRGSGGPVTGQTTAFGEGGFSGAIKLPENSRFVQYEPAQAGHLIAKGSGPDASKQLAPNAQPMTGWTCMPPEIPAEKYSNGIVRAERYSGDMFPRGSYVRYYKDGAPAKIVLAGDVVLQGIEFERGDYVELDQKTGKIIKVATYHPVKIGDLTLAPVFTPELYGTCEAFGRSVTFASDMYHDDPGFIELTNGIVRKGVLAAGGIYGDSIELPSGTLVNFNARGRLEKAEFLLPQNVGELFVTEASFDSKGRLSYAVLAEDMPIGRSGTVFMKGEWIRFHENGEPSMGTLAFDQEMNGVPCAGGSTADLYPSSVLNKCTSTRDFTYEHGGAVYACGEDRNVWLYENKRLNLCELSSQQYFRVKGMKKRMAFAPRTTIGLDGSGRVEQGGLVPGQIVYGVKLGTGPESKVELDPSSAKGVLAEDTVIDGVDLKKGTYVVISPKGKLIQIRLESPQKIRGVLLKADEYYEFDKKGVPHIFIYDV